MRLYYVYEKPDEGVARWIVEAPSEARRFFATRTQAIEWASRNAERSPRPSKLLVLHDDRQWRLEASFENIEDPATGT